MLLRRNPRRRLLALLASTAAGCTFTVAGPAQALGINSADCNFGFKDSYNAGDAVCITGELDIIDPGGSPVCAAAWVYVIPTGAANPYADVSMGGANYVQGCAGAGAFFDEIVWLPPLIPGGYEFVVDQYPFGGGLGNEDLRTGQAFTVTNAPINFSVDVAAIKAAAAEGLKAAQALHNLTELLALIDTLSTAADWAIAFGPGGAAAAIALSVICTATGTDCPTSYNSAVIIIGNKILGGIANGMALKYLAIIADPPDPAFDVVVPLAFTDANMLGAPWTPGADQVVPNSQISIAQQLAVQTAAYEALVPSLEKLQGAQQAQDHTGLLVQAEKTKGYAQLAMDSGEAMLVQLQTLEDHLSSQGALDSLVNAQEIVTRLATEGLNDEEKNLALSFGYSQADIDMAPAGAANIEAMMQVGWQPMIDQARKSYLDMKPALVDMVNQTEQIRQENEPYALVTRPRASLMGAASGSVGVATALTATATHYDSNAVISYSWDFNGDGVFDDASGANVDFIPQAPGMQVVSMRASDGTLDDVQHLPITVAISNAPPELTNLMPTEIAPFAEVGEAVAFHAEATDTDGDAVTLTWFVDGSELGSGTDFEYTMADEEPHKVRVVAADSDSFSPDAETTFVVRAAKWQGQTGEGGSGGSGGSSSGSGAGNGSGGNGNSDGGGDDSCGCSLVGPSSSYGAWLAAFGLAGLFWRRRRRAV